MVFTQTVQMLSYIQYTIYSIFMAFSQIMQMLSYIQYTIYNMQYIYGVYANNADFVA